MSQLIEAELRLCDVIREAREFIVQLRTMQDNLSDAYKDLPKKAQKQHADILKALEKSAAMITTMKRETHFANEVFNQIEGHAKWKKAVLEVFGEDGLRQCFDYMQNKREVAHD